MKNMLTIRPEKGRPLPTLIREQMGTGPVDTKVPGLGALSFLFSVFFWSRSVLERLS
jgi:hypothetical protein